MKFIITENQYSRLLLEQKVYTSKTEYDNAMIKYEKDLKQYNIDYQNYKNRLNKWITDVKSTRIPLKASPGRKITWLTSDNQTNLNKIPKPIFNKKKPTKPIYKEQLKPKPPIINSGNTSDTKFPEYKVLSPEEIKKKFDACSKGGIQVGTPHRGYTFYKSTNKEFIEGGWACDEQGNKKSVPELFQLGIIK